jgi:hypothetical protein
MGILNKYVVLEYLENWMNENRSNIQIKECLFQIKSQLSILIDRCNDLESYYIALNGEPLEANLSEDEIAANNLWQINEKSRLGK